MSWPAGIGPSEVYLYIDLLKNSSIMSLGIFLVFTVIVLVLIENHHQTVNLTSCCHVIKTV